MKPYNTTYINAKQSVNKSNKFSYKLASIFLSKKNFPYFIYWYSYFRWVDDCADEGNLTNTEKITFIDKQIDLIKTINSGKTIDDNLQEGEIYVEELFKFERKEYLYSYVYNMLECIKFDIQRTGKSVKESELNFYFSKEVLSYLNTFNLFCSTKYFAELDVSHEGIAGKWAHILRDMQKDYISNLYNITFEDQIKYNINLNGLFDADNKKGFSKYVEEKTQEAFALFKHSRPFIRKYKSLRFKFIVFTLCVKYVAYLIKIKSLKFEINKSVKISITEVIKSIFYVVRNVI